MQLISCIVYNQRLLSIQCKQVEKQSIEDFDTQHGNELNRFYNNIQTNIRHLHHIYQKKEILKDIERVQKIIMVQEKQLLILYYCFNFLKRKPYDYFINLYIIQYTFLKAQMGIKYNLWGLKKFLVLQERMIINGQVLRQ
ncbi:unnamed protein product [Paramecium octaurelia]|uniref:Uncharacterized protein n=1 Tax=Paramecium octaurelia TaxID=43137 RepID=A0A8S1WBQ8_PAROT|nr:unnamed protein product [Paramecium octaurelia]